MALRDVREARNISQSELAKASGLHRSYIGDLERGARNLSLKNLHRLSSALDLPASKVLLIAERKIFSRTPEVGERSQKGAKLGAAKSIAKSVSKSPASLSAERNKKAVKKEATKSKAKSVIKMRAKTKSGRGN